MVDVFPLLLPVLIVVFPLYGFVVIEVFLIVELVLFFKVFPFLMFKVDVLTLVFGIIVFVFTPLPLECEDKEPLCPVVWLLLLY